MSDGTVRCIDDEIPFEIPQSWQWVRLQNVVQLNPKIKATDSVMAGFIPMEKIEATYLSQFSFIERNWGEIKSGFTHFADGDVAFAKITPCFQNRKSMILHNLPNGIGAGTTELKVLRPYANTIKAEYLLFFLESAYFVEEATFKGTANQQRIISGYLETKPFPLPPYSEQYRIVDKIHELLPICEQFIKSQTALDKLNVEVNTNLKRSILQEAIQGRLVPQIESEGTAQELLAEIRSEKQRLVKEGKLKKSALANESRIFRGEDNRYYEQIGESVTEIDVPFELPSNWIFTRIGNICQLVDGEKREGTDICLDAKYLRGKGISYVSKGRYIAKGKRLILVDGENSGEVFTAQIAGYLGSTFKELWIACTLQSDYILLFLRLYKELLRNSKKGSAIPHLNKDIFYGLIIGIPPIKEQIRITNRVYNLFKHLK